MPRNLERPTGIRYGVLLALGLAAASAYLTRGLSAANTTIAKEFAFDDDRMGYLLASFYLGYVGFQVPTGWLANRFGPRLVLPAIAVLWSLCTAWTSLATTAAELFCARIGLGAAQAGLVPCCGKVLGDWFPGRRRGLASAVLGASMQLGGLLASGLTAELLPQLGWRQTFLRYSLVGVAWGIAFYAWFRNRPEEHRGTNAAERDLIRGQTEPVAEIREDDSATESSASDFPFNSEPTAAKSDEPSALSGGALLWAMLTSASLWAVCGQQFFRAFSYELFTSWFPAYLEKGHGMQVVKSGKWGMLPIFGVLLGSLLGGWVVDALMTRTGSKRLSRSGAAMLAMVLCAACIQTAATAQSPELMVGIIALGMFFWALSGPAAWAATLDISGRHSAILFGLMNMCGNLGALACPIVLGYLFRQISASHGDWNLVLYVFVGINLAGAACWAVLDPNRPVVAARNSEHAPP